MIVKRYGALFFTPVRFPAILLHGVVFGLLCAGCAGPMLNAARENFYMARLDRAAANLKNIPDDDKDRVLFLMERGAVNQSGEEYEASTRDWLEAQELMRQSDYYSLTQGSASLVVNDRVKTFLGAPYERTLLRSFLAKNYFAMSMWDDAAVEARNIVVRLENLGGFPDDAYSRYVAGLAFEMINDYDGAALQYRIASELLEHIRIDERTGRIIPRTEGDEDDKAQEVRSSSHGVGKELVCLVMMGRSPMEFGVSPRNYSWGNAPYAEIYHKEKYLGRSYTLSDTKTLMTATEKRLAALRVAKQVGRITAKELAARTVSNKNEFLGELLRLILFTAETPDTRRWETLPLWLQAARVECPPDVDGYRIVFIGVNGRKVGEKTVSAPLSSRGNVVVSFCRYLQ